MKICRFVALSLGHDLCFVLTNPSGKYVTTEGVAPPPSAHRGQKISERINQFLEVFVCCPGLGVMLQNLRENPIIPGLGGAGGVIRPGAGGVLAPCQQYCAQDQSYDYLKCQILGTVDAECHITHNIGCRL